MNAFILAVGVSLVGWPTLLFGGDYEIVSYDTQAAICAEVEEPELPIEETIHPMLEQGKRCWITNQHNTEDETVLAINVKRVIDAYNKEVDYPEWDKKKRTRIFNALYEFLVVQQNVGLETFAGICGNVYMEGKFGQIEDGARADSYETLMAYAEGSGGLGVCQWTSRSRKDKLKDYYELLHDFDFTFEETVIIAECCFLYFELQDRKDIDFDRAYDVEDACGRVAYRFEAYNKSATDWYANADKEFRLSPTYQGSGASRLNIAEQVYLQYYYGAQ